MHDSSSSNEPGLLHHGGRLRAAAAHYGIPLGNWLDLSTGINPIGYPVPPVPEIVWARLPEDDDGLEAAAQAYYGTKHLFPVAGSQAAIQTLPRLRAASRVSIIAPGYAEHAHAWRSAGHDVQPVTAEQLEEGLPAHIDVLLLIHPNNPTGARFAVERLLDWHAQLAARGGWLVVDEAFMDTTPEQTLAPYSGRTGLLVLRSLGKFFGLAGARVGFVCAQPELLRRLHALLGPWSISAPARWAATAALTDTAWQQATRTRLLADGERLRSLLTRHGLEPTGGCALFQWIATPDAARLHEQLARQAVFTRLFDEPSAVRLGLPGSEREWQRLDTTLSELRQ